MNVLLYLQSCTLSANTIVIESVSKHLLAYPVIYIVRPPPTMAATTGLRAFVTAKTGPSVRTSCGCHIWSGIAVSCLEP